MRLKSKPLLFILLFLSAHVLWAQQGRHIRIDSINSAYDEQNPVLSPDGNTLFFTRSGHTGNIGGLLDKGDIWYSERKEDGSWGTPVHGGQLLNHSGLNGVVGFSPDGRTIYLLNYREGTHTGAGSIKNGIASARRVNGKWQPPELLRITYFTNRSGHISASITPDEKIMIIAMQSYQTFGNEDLYVTFRQGDGSWSQPMNLGEDINTFSEEWSPYLAPDGETLYFSSNGHEGYGSRDIFVSKRLDDSWKNWSKPLNLGASINTKGVELGYFIPSQGDVAYFSSTQNSEGFGDIFNFPLSNSEKAIQPVAVQPEPSDEPAHEDPAMPEEQPLVAMTLQVLDITTAQPVDALVMLTYGNEKVTVDTRQASDEEKRFMITVAEGTAVAVEIRAEGYLNYKEEFVVNASPREGGSDPGPVERFRLTPDDIGTKIVIEDVLFERGKATFADSAQAHTQLNKLIALLEANPGMTIRLEGHTDSRGNPELLKRLSEDRVNTVKDYLTLKKIDARRIGAIGYGGSRPVAENSSEAGRRKNRRVEFVVISH